MAANKNLDIMKGATVEQLMSAFKGDSEVQDALNLVLSRAVSPDKTEIKKSQIRGIPTPRKKTRRDGSEFFEIEIFMGRDANGKKHSRSVIGNTIAEVNKKAVALYNQKIQGAKVPQSKKVRSATVEEVLWEYVKDKAKSGNITPSTAQGYGQKIRTYITQRTGDNKNLPDIKNIKVNQLTSRHIQDLYNDMIEKGLAGESVQHLHRVIRPAFKKAVKLGKMLSNPCDNVELPKQIKTSKTSIATEGMARLLQACKTVDGAELVAMGLETGMRSSEARALRWNDINFRSSTIRIDEGLVYVAPNRELGQDKGYYHIGNNKNAYSKRTIEMPVNHLIFPILAGLKAKRSEELLKAGEKVLDTDLVFSNLDGTCWGNTRTRNILKKVIEISGVDMANDYRLLRHTHATVSLLNGEDISQVSRRLGHADISTTLKFYNDIIKGGERNSLIKLQEALDNAMSKVEVMN